MIPIRLCFLGTPEFASAHLRSLLKNPDYKIVGVVTQPDRPSGRKLQLTASPVKTIALENQLPVLTPENLKKSVESLEIIKSWQADIAVVVAYGQILSQEFLDSFKYGAVNVHGSLLPLWRGAAPIQRSLEAGDRETGVSLQRMVRKLDAGAVIGQRVVQLDDTITATELYEKLSLLGCELLEQDLIRYVKSEIIPKEQDEKYVTHAAKIDKSESLLSWNLSAESFHNRVRAFTMGPGTFVDFQGKRLKIHKTKILDTTSKGIIGSIVKLSSTELAIQTAIGVITLLIVQPESKPKMPISDFLKSNNLKEGDLFV